MFELIRYFSEEDIPLDCLIGNSNDHKEVNFDNKHSEDNTIFNDKVTEGFKHDENTARVSDLNMMAMRPPSNPAMVMRLTSTLLL